MAHPTHRTSLLTKLWRAVLGHAEDEDMGQEAAQDAAQDEDMGQLQPINPQEADQSTRKSWFGCAFRRGPEQTQQVEGRGRKRKREYRYREGPLNKWYCARGWSWRRLRRYTYLDTNYEDPAAPIYNLRAGADPWGEDDNAGGLDLHIR
jgi:hypothetical protein